MNETNEKNEKSFFYVYQLIFNDFFLSLLSILSREDKREK